MPFSQEKHPPFFLLADATISSNWLAGGSPANSASPKNEKNTPQISS